MGGNKRINQLSKHLAAASGPLGMYEKDVSFCVFFFVHYRKLWILSNLWYHYDC